MNYSFFRALKFAFQDFWRNIWLSLVTITVLVLAFLSVNILISLQAVSKEIVASVEEKVDVSVFFKAEAERAEIDNFTERLKSIPEVKETRFISREEALNKFKQDHQDEPKLLQAIEELEENPLVDVLVIKANSIEEYNQILPVIQLEENQALIEYQDFTDHQKIIERVKIISNKVRQAGIVLTAIFAFIAILIVYNAIRVNIYIHKEEIGVMRLVGAGNGFIRSPFILESFIYATVSLVVSLVILYATFGAISPYIAEFLKSYDFNLIAYYNQNFIKIFGVQYLAVLLLTIISSGLAIGKYMRV